MQEFNESRFRAQVAAAVHQMNAILDNARSPQTPDNVQHKYEDKFGLSEWLGHATIASTVEALRHLGASDEQLNTMREWATSRSVTLRFSRTERCSYLREETRTEESPTVVHESTLFGSGSAKVVTKIVEHFWRFTSEWELTAFVGTGSEMGETLRFANRMGACEMKTSQKSAPRKEVKVAPFLDTRLTFIFQNVDSSLKPTFKIDRADKLCRTPRRNVPVTKALDFARSLFAWARSVQSYLVSDLAPLHVGHGLDLAAASNDSTLFVPVVAVFEQSRQGPPIEPHLRNIADPPPPKQLQLLPAGEAEEVKEEQKHDEDGDAGAVVPAGAAAADPLAVIQSYLLSSDDTVRLFAEQRRSLEARKQQLTSVFPSVAAAAQHPGGRLFCHAEATITLVAAHLLHLLQAYADGVQFLEELLRKQLTAAIGKELRPLDFALYMQFHFAKIFRAAFQPKLFSFAIRRPQHAPEGTVSIESSEPSSSSSDGNPQPILTHTRHIEPSWPMHFALNAATQVSFRGARYLHGYVSQQFADSTPPNLTLHARARQFSSFIVLLGTLSGAHLFQPKHAFIAKDKDEFSIPLHVEILPSAGEFKDAIESLSPEQQRFAKAIRAMQLEGSMFGVLVIQIKPQLEKLLRLPDDALTKEIQLTQDLQELLQLYQIPSDLLSYSGDEDAHVSLKLRAVQKQVNAMKRLIQTEKDGELAQRMQEAAYAQAERRRESSKTMESESVERLNLCGGGGGGERFRSLRKGGPPPSVGGSRGGRASAAAPSQSLSRNSHAPPPQLHQQMQQQLSNAPSTRASSSTSSSSSVAAVPAAASQSAPAQEQAPTPVAEAGESDAAVAAVDGPGLDWTALPAALDAKLLALDPEQALRPTIISAGHVWSKREQKSLLSPASTSRLLEADQTRAKQAAFDLLDALSRAGSLSIDCCELHVLLAATHRFDSSLMDEVIVNNCNPIEPMERSALLLAAAIHADKPPSELIKAEYRERTATYAARPLFEEENKQIAAQRQLQLDAQ